jgi:hypothetical protein
MGIALRVGSLSRMLVTAKIGAMPLPRVMKVCQCFEVPGVADTSATIEADRPCHGQDLRPP